MSDTTNSSNNNKSNIKKQQQKQWGWPPWRATECVEDLVKCQCTRNLCLLCKELVCQLEKLQKCIRGRAAWGRANSPRRPQKKRTAGVLRPMTTTRTRTDMHASTLFQMHVCACECLCACANIEVGSLTTTWVWGSGCGSGRGSWVR